MSRLISLLVFLCGLALAAPRAQITSQGITFIARPGALIAQKGGQEMWRKTGLFRDARTLELLLTPDKKMLLVLSDLGLGRDSYLGAYAMGTGKRLWQTTIVDEVSNAVLDLRGVSQGNALISAYWGQPRIRRVIIVSLGSGEVLYKKPGELLGFSGRYAALLDYGLNLEVPANAWLPLVKLDMDKAKRTYIGLTIPKRPNCGEVMSRNPGQPDLRYDDKYITALRKDKCGEFTVKVDWHARPGTRPIITPAH